MKKDKLTPKIKCPNCEYTGPAMSGNNGGLLTLCILVAVFLFPLGLLALVFYYYKTNKLKCPRCKFTNVYRTYDDTKQE
jgi:hypothetical protein